MLYRQAAPDGRYWPLLAGGGNISNLNISLSNINSVTTQPSPAQSRDHPLLTFNFNLGFVPYQRRFWFLFLSIWHFRELFKSIQNLGKTESKLEETN